MAGAALGVAHKLDEPRYHVLPGFIPGDRAQLGSSDIDFPFHGRTLLVAAQGLSLAASRFNVDFEGLADHHPVIGKRSMPAGILVDPITQTIRRFAFKRAPVRAAARTDRRDAIAGRKRMIG